MKKPFNLPAEVFPDRWKKYSCACALVALAIGAVGFSGWIFNIDALTRIHPALVSMKFNAAVCLIVAACSLLVLQNQNVGKGAQHLAQAGGIFIALVGMLTLSEILFHLDLGIDQIFFHETAQRAGRSFPGRMGFASTLIFITLGTGLFFLPKKSRVSSVCALFAALLTLLIFLIYFYEVESARTNLYLTIALHTVVAFFALSAGILFARPRSGILELILSDTLAGKIARRMAVGALILPIFLGWLRTLGRNVGLFGPGFGTAIFVVLIILIFAGLIWWTVFAITREEVDRKRAEQFLRESEEQLRVITDVTPGLISYIDKDFRYRFVNRQYELWFGHTREQILGKSMGEVLGDDAFARLRPHINRALAGEKVHFESEMPYRYGGTRFVEGFYVPDADSSGVVRGFYVLVVDITERKQTEKALHQSEENFRAMADNIAPLAWMANPDGWIFFYNKRWYDFTGTTFEDMQGWGWERVQHPEYLPRMLPRWKAALERGESWEDTFPLRSKDGQYRWFLSRAFPIRDDAGKITRWFGVNTDITELRDAQGALQNAQTKLQEHATTLEQKVKERTIDLKETNEQLEAFVYSIAHDLRAPLRAMQGFSQILMDDHAPSLDETARQYLERINGSSEFMDKMILDLLAFGRAGRAETQLDPVPVQSAWNTALFQYARQIEQTDTQIETVQPLPTVLAHEATLAQVLANLLSNAIKFIPKDVRPKIRLWAEGRGETVRLWVQDNGVGIAPEQHERVFRVFERLHGARYPGTGIGLSIVRKGVERMGGQVGLESQPGQGSKFWIELRKA